MQNIFPPVLESRHEAIWYSDTMFSIKFLMPAINGDRRNTPHLQLSIRYKNTNRSAVNSDKSPDRSVLYCNISQNSSAFFLDEVTRMATLTVPYELFENGHPNKGVEYILQIRFGQSSLWDRNAGPGWCTTNFNTFAAWFKQESAKVPSGFGEWSNLQYVYCADRATMDLQVKCVDFVPRVIVSYSPSENNSIIDPVEQIILQWDWDGDDGMGNTARQYRTMTFSGQYQESDIFTFEQDVPIAPVTRIHFSVDMVTAHNARYVANYNFPRKIADIPVAIPSGEIFDAEIGSAETEDGVLAKSFQYKGNMATSGYTYRVYRYNLSNLECVKIKEGLSVEKDTMYSVKDYTVEMGEEYQYVVGLADEAGEVKYLLRELTDCGKGSGGYGRLMNMEVSFLDDKYHQLRLHGGVKVSAFKRNVSDQFQATIGGKYPFYIRNGAQNYRTLNLSAVISINFDPTFTFLRLRDGIGLSWEDGDISKKIAEEDLLTETNSFSHSRWRVGHPNGDEREQPQIQELGQDAGFSLAAVATEDGPEMQWKLQAQQYEVLVQSKSIYSEYYQNNRASFIGTDQHDNTVFLERKFRDLVMAWLSDGRPKLYRSETEGNMIVMVSNAQFTPLDKTQRMVYQVSFTLTEIAEYNLLNLIDFNLVPSEIISNYSKTGEWDFTPGEPDKWVMTGMTLSYQPIYDIPATIVGHAIKRIDLSTAVNNGGIRQYWWSNDLPKGVTLNPTTGVISGIAGEVKPATKATIHVKNDLGQEATMVINVGIFYRELQVTPQQANISGKKIGEEIDGIHFTVAAGFEGTPPYNWELSNRDLGLYLVYDDAMGSGVTVYGALRQEVTLWTISLTVRDANGMEDSATIAIREVQAPLVFNQRREWFQLGEYEENEMVPEINFLPEVSGGTGRYHFSWDNNHPRGLSLTEEGRMFGAPSGENYPTSSKTTIVTVRDDAGATATVTLVFLPIYEEFQFRKPAGIDPINLLPNPVYVYTIMTDQDIQSKVIASDGRPPVIGGKPPYYFSTQAEINPAILDNFSVSSYGILQAHLIQTCDAGNIYAVVQDSRGKIRRITLACPKVIGDFNVVPPAGGLHIPSGKIGTAAFQPPYFVLTAGNFRGLLADDPPNGDTWTWSVTGAPPGVTLEWNKNNQCFEMIGIPTGDYPSGVGAIQFTNGHNKQASVTFTVGEVYGELYWSGAVIIPSQRVGGPSIRVPLPDISGGQPPYTLSGDISPYRFSPGNSITQKNGLAIIGAPGNISQDRKVVPVTVRDKAGDIAAIEVDIGDIYGTFTVEANSSPTDVLFVNHSTIPQPPSPNAIKVGSVKGQGKGPFVFSYNGGATLPGGLMLSPDGYIYGTPSAPNPRMNIGPYITVEDQSSNISVTGIGDYYLPQISNLPTLGDAPFVNGVVDVGDKVIGDNATTPWSLFKNDSPEKGTVSPSSNLVPEVMVDPSSYKLTGNYTESRDNITTKEITLTIPGNKYHPNYTIKCTVKIGKVTGPMQYIAVPNKLALPAYEINKKITDLLVSEGRTGGVGPFKWSVTGLEGTGLTLRTTGTRNQECFITGTPTAKKGRFNITITVEDEGSPGKSASITIPGGGFYDPLTVQALPEIPARKATEEITPIELNSKVSGGSGNYRWAEKVPGEMLKHGIKFNTMNWTIVTGSQEYSSDAATIILIVTDASTTLSKEVPLKVGKITGKMGLKQEKISIPGGSRNTAFPNIEIKNYIIEGTGGAKTYVPDSANDIPADWKTVIILDKSTGRLSGKRPNKAVEAGLFKIIITDTDGTVQGLDVATPKIT